MNKKTGFVIFLLLLIAGGALLWQRYSPVVPGQKVSPDFLSLVLDWTPNTNHTGIYVALAKKWYAEEGIDLRILPYSGAILPDVVVASGKADIGISSTEAIVADQAAGAPVVSIAAIVAHNTSGLAARTDSGITRPSELDGKIYGGYGAPYEEAVVSTMIRRDGGTGAFKNVTLGVDALEALAGKRIDFAWIYSGWEGIQAKREGLALTVFPVGDFGIPDYSTPDIITSPKALSSKKDVLKKFMRATARGYEYARVHPEESAQILINEAPSGTFPDPGLVTESQNYLSPRYADAGKKWGLQSESSWHDYPAFMLEKGAVLDAGGKPVNAIDFSALYTNELLP